ncbi:MAG: AAA family ATPase [Clostridia bacterium]|nr:AAA family ATPase [Clostridia bacterium]
MFDKRLLEHMYDDFFGIETLKKENENLAEALAKNDSLELKVPKLNQEKKEITMSENDTTMSNENSKEVIKLRNDKMAEIFEKIDNLYISEQSKNTMKKIIEYMRKYNEKIEKEFISFNMCIYSNSKEISEKIIEILSESVKYFNYLQEKENKIVSFYEIDTVEKIDEIYNQNNIVCLKNFEGFIGNDKNFKDKVLYKFEENLEKEQSITILLAKNEDEIKNGLEQKYDWIKEKYFNFEIISTSPDIQDIYQEILSKLEESEEIPEKVSFKLLDYIAATYPKTNLQYTDYKNKLYEQIIFSKNGKITEKDIPEYEKDKSIEETFAELNDLVGLENVKQTLKDLVSLIELKNKAKDELKIKNVNLHMVFLGNPGTGKTTVARIVAQILYNLKYIQKNKLIEVSSKDLVAEYVGQTGPKTMAVIEKAMGGVLFIDEAYTLASGNGNGNSFNEEAIATLIQAMENYRDNLVVIFAGYTKEMQAFLDANSGIVSRIGYTLQFEDYTSEELITIFESMIKKSGFEIEETAKQEALKVIEEYKDSKNFGNARFVRNLYEKTIIKHASNTRNKKSKKILKTIKKEDISTENLLKG